MKYKTKYWKQESNWINLEIVTHSNLPPEWFDTISEEIQGACSLKTSNFSLISPLIWRRKTTNRSIKKKEEIKIFVSQSFPHHYWVSLKVEVVSLLAHFSFTGLSSHPVCLSDIAGLIQQQHSGWIVLTNYLRKTLFF